jgi:hypothetical protein
MGEIQVIVDRYKITDGRNSIYMTLAGEKLAITPGDRVEKQTFNFCLSDKETVRSIANLMLTAVDVAETGICPKR